MKLGNSNERATTQQKMEIEGNVVKIATVALSEDSRTHLHKKIDEETGLGNKDEKDAHNGLDSKNYKAKKGQ